MVFVSPFGAITPGAGVHFNPASTALSQNQTSPQNQKTTQQQVEQQAAVQNAAFSNSNLSAIVGPSKPAAKPATAASGTQPFNVQQAQQSGFQVIPAPSQQGGYLLQRGGITYNVYGTPISSSSPGGSVSAAPGGGAFVNQGPQSISPGIGNYVPPANVVSRPFAQSVSQSPFGAGFQGNGIDYTQFGQNASINFTTPTNFTGGYVKNGQTFTFQGSLPANAQTQSQQERRNEAVDIAYEGLNYGIQSPNVPVGAYKAPININLDNLSSPGAISGGGYYTSLGSTSQSVPVLQNNSAFNILANLRSPALSRLANQLILGAELYAAENPSAASLSQFQTVAKEGVPVIGQYSGASPTLEAQRQGAQPLSQSQSELSKLAESLSLLSSPLTLPYGLYGDLSNIYSYLSGNPQANYAIKTAFKPTTSGTLLDQIRSTPVFGASQNINVNLLNFINAVAINNPRAATAIGNLISFANSNPQAVAGYIAATAPQLIGTLASYLPNTVPFIYNLISNGKLPYLEVKPPKYTSNEQQVADLVNSIYNAYVYVLSNANNASGNEQYAYYGQPIASDLSKIGGKLNTVPYVGGLLGQPFQMAAGLTSPSANLTPAQQAGYLTELGLFGLPVGEGGAEAVNIGSEALRSGLYPELESNTAQLAGERAAAQGAKQEYVSANPVKNFLEESTKSGAFGTAFTNAATLGQQGRLANPNEDVLSFVAGGTLPVGIEATRFAGGAIDYSTRYALSKLGLYNPVEGTISPEFLAGIRSPSAPLLRIVDALPNDINILKSIISRSGKFNKLGYEVPSLEGLDAEQLKSVITLNPEYFKSGLQEFTLAHIPKLVIKTVLKDGYESGTLTDGQLDEILSHNQIDLGGIPTREQKYLRLQQLVNSNQPPEFLITKSYTLGQSYSWTLDDILGALKGTSITPEGSILVHLSDLPGLNKALNEQNEAGVRAGNPSAVRKGYYTGYGLYQSVPVIGSEAETIETPTGFSVKTASSEPLGYGHYAGLNNRPEEIGKEPGTAIGNKYYGTLQFGRGLENTYLPDEFENDIQNTRVANYPDAVKTFFYGIRGAKEGKNVLSPQIQFRDQAEREITAAPASTLVKQNKFDIYTLRQNQGIVKNVPILQDLIPTITKGQFVGTKLAPVDLPTIYERLRTDPKFRQELDSVSEDSFLATVDPTKDTYGQALIRSRETYLPRFKNGDILLGVERNGQIALLGGGSEGRDALELGELNQEVKGITASNARKIGKYKGQTNYFYRLKAPFYDHHTIVSVDIEGKPQVNTAELKGLIRYKPGTRLPNGLSSDARNILISEAIKANPGIDINSLEPSEQITGKEIAREIDLSSADTANEAAKAPSEESVNFERNNEIERTNGYPQPYEISEPYRAGLLGYPEKNEPSNFNYPQTEPTSYSNNYPQPYGSYIPSYAYPSSYSGYPTNYPYLPIYPNYYGYPYRRTVKTTNYPPTPLLTGNIIFNPITGKYEEIPQEYQNIYSGDPLTLLFPELEAKAEREYNVLTAISGLRPQRRPQGAAPLLLQGNDIGKLNQQTEVSANSPGLRILQTIGLENTLNALNQIEPQKFSANAIQFADRLSLFNAIRDLSKDEIARLIDSLPQEQRNQIYLSEVAENNPRQSELVSV